MLRLQEAPSTVEFMPARAFPLPGTEPASAATDQLHSLLWEMEMPGGLGPRGLSEKLIGSVGIG